MKKENILIFTAHPDDAEIGMGGTISYLIDKGFNVVLVIGFCRNIQRDIEAQNSSNFLGTELVIVDYPFHSKRDVIEKFDTLIEKYKPHSVFTQWVGDSHQEHKRMAEYTFAISRKNNFNVYMFEGVIPGGLTEKSFRPQLFIDITEYMDKKIKAIGFHKSQTRKNGKWWLEGLRGRAMYRGYQCNAKYAESFEIIKQIGI